MVYQFVAGDQLPHPVEDRPAAGGSGVEVDQEFVEVGGQVGLPRRALVGAQQRFTQEPTRRIAGSRSPGTWSSARAARWLLRSSAKPSLSKPR